MIYCLESPLSIKRFKVLFLQRFWSSHERNGWENKKPLGNFFKPGGDLEQVTWGEMDFPHRGDKMVTSTMFPQGKRD